MSETRIADVIVPEIFTDYVVENTATKSNIIQSGLAVRLPEYDEKVAAGGYTFNMPFWGDLSGDSEILKDDTALTVNSISSGKQVCPKLFRGKAFGSNDLAGALAGSDPTIRIADRFRAYWDREQQTILVNVLKSLFGSTGVLASSHYLNKAIEDNAVSGATEVDFAATDFINLTQLLGDTMDDLEILCVHSKVYATLKINNLIDFVEDSEQGLTIPFYQGKRVIVDDGCPVRDGTGATSGNTAKVYTSFAFQRGAFGIGIGIPTAFVPFETDRNSLAGYDVIISRLAMAIHPMGIKWTPGSGVPADETPSNAELADADNWTKAYTDDKNIRIVAMDTNG